ncbi:hypothetical protein SERLADRAFT_388112 [Serpula lacrymans var. lacrymans S7.9]|uniref:Uncharacterized protein n=1 Tax=Serpula lacrymans var. lacrymans (strain S7.9) TaxID=578457 RepID=F8NTQ8_SERL9|nr:uncharacterized protein SERLADRAFT_388112 [Serpula lacrymans var. lacrymans S7.9]EGO25728.1 hypothetical protein SERLADRAFT_388112 [Serpula lacrymans var. lacrymans S7.9]
MPLPNPHDPFPERPVSMISPISATSPTALGSVPPSSFQGQALAAVGGASSSSRTEDRVLDRSSTQSSTLHSDLTLYQKQLELDHRKRSLDARDPDVPSDPPPLYSRS